MLRPALLSKSMYPLYPQGPDRKSGWYMYPLYPVAAPPMATETKHEFSGGAAPAEKGISVY